MPVTQRPMGDLSALARDASNEVRPPRAADIARIPPPAFSWKSRILLPGAILLAVLLLIGYTARDTILPATEVRVVPVIIKASNEAATTGGATVQAPGWVEADPYPIAVSALADGIVREVLALEGQAINAGDVVARMIDDDAKLALARADATLLEKKATLEAAKRNWDNPTELKRVIATSEAMVTETKADLEKLVADVNVEEARLIAAKVESERLTQSFQTRASSEVETIRAQQAFEAQKAVVEATKARRPVLLAQLAQREADLHAAKERLELRIDERKSVAEAEAQLALATPARDEAALRLARMEVRSPASGVVMQRLAAPGDKLVMNMDAEHSAHVVRLYDPAKLQVRVDVPLADAAKIGVGQPAKVVVAVAPDRTFDGVVTRIVNEADIQKNTLQVKVAITNPSPELKPEMLARVRISTGATTTAPSGTQTLFAPIDLIERAGNQAFVWIVDSRRGVAVRRTLTLGEFERDGWIAIREGLSAGDRVIATEGRTFSDGQRVRVVGEASSTRELSRTESHGAH